MTRFEIVRDNSGAVAYGLVPSDTNFVVALTASTESTLAVPASSNYSKFVAVFSYSAGATVFVGHGTTALTIPTGSFSASSASISPPVRQYSKGDTLRFLSADTGMYVGVSFYGIG